MAHIYHSDELVTGPLVLGQLFAADRSLYFSTVSGTILRDRTFVVDVTDLHTLTTRNDFYALALAPTGDIVASQNLRLGLFSGAILDRVWWTAGTCVEGVSVYPLFSPDSIFVRCGETSGDQVTVKLAIESGQDRWRLRDADTRFLGAAGLVALSFGGYSLVDSESGSIRSTCQPVAASNGCYSMDGAGRLHCAAGAEHSAFDPRDCSLAWRTPTQRFDSGWATTADDSEVFVSGSRVQTIDASGRLADLARLPDGLSVPGGAPTIDGQGNIYIAANGSGGTPSMVISLDAKGALRWQQPLEAGRYFWRPLLVLGSQSRLFMVTCDGNQACRVDGMAG